MYILVISVATSSPDLFLVNYDKSLLSPHDKVSDKINPIITINIFFKLITSGIVYNRFFTIILKKTHSFTVDFFIIYFF